MANKTIKTKYDKKQNIVFVITILLAIIEIGALSINIFKIGNRTDKLGNQVIEVQKDLVDVEKLLEKKEAEYLYDYNNTDFNSSQKYWLSKSFSSNEIYKYSFLAINIKPFLHEEGSSVYDVKNWSDQQIIAVDSLKTISGVENSKYQETFVVDGNYVGVLTATFTNDTWDFAVSSKTNIIETTTVYYNFLIDYVIGIY